MKERLLRKKPETDKRPIRQGSSRMMRRLVAVVVSEVLIVPAGVSAQPSPPDAIDAVLAAQNDIRNNNPPEGMVYPDAAGIAALVQRDCEVDYVSEITYQTKLGSKVVTITLSADHRRIAEDVASNGSTVDTDWIPCDSVNISTIQVAPETIDGAGHAHALGKPVSISEPQNFSITAADSPEPYTLRATTELSEPLKSSQARILAVKLIRGWHSRVGGSLNQPFGSNNGSSDAVYKFGARESVNPATTSPVKFSLRNN